MVKRLITFVWATIPTFWLNVAKGKAPNIAPIVEFKPSDTNVPPSSRQVGVLPNPAIVRAVVSPIASTMATVKQTDVKTQGTTSNLILEKSIRIRKIKL